MVAALVAGAGVALALLAPAGKRAEILAVTAVAAPAAHLGLALYGADLGRDLDRRVEAARAAARERKTLEEELRRLKGG